MPYGGVGAGFIMLLIYGISMLKRGLKYQNDRDQAVGGVCVMICILIVVLGLKGMLGL